MNALERATSRGRIHNRIAAVMVHIKRYTFRGVALLASDAGVSRSEVSRLLRGLTNPSYVVVERICDCLELHAGRKLDIREIVSETGQYPTAYVCDLMNCSGCLPAYAFTQDGDMIAEYKSMQAGRWSGDVVPSEKFLLINEEYGNAAA